MANLTLFSQSAVLAQITNPALPDFQPDQGASIVSRLLSTIIPVLLVVGVFVCFLYLIIGSLRWIAAKGDKNYLQEARDTISHAVLGLIILFAIFAILNLIGYLFGFNLMNLEIPTIIQSGT